MEPIITKTNLQEVAENDIDEQGKRLKLREESFENVSKNVPNIPYVSVEPVSEEDNFVLLPKTDMEVENGPSKAINIKKNSMFANLLRRVKRMETEQKNLEPTVEETIKVEEEIKTEEEVEPEKEEKVQEEPEVNIDIPTPVVDVKPTKKANKNSKKTTAVEKEPTAEKESIVENTIPVYDKNTDLDKYFSNVDVERQEIKDMKTQAETATKEVSESAEQVNKLAIEEAEVQKKLEEAEARKAEIDRKIMEAYENQKITLASVKEKYKSVIDEANKSKEENQIKISESQSRIDNTRSKLTDIEAEIAQQQNILSAISDLEVPDDIMALFAPKEDVASEEIVKAKI